eukprot:m.337555 g.337555  ORF g.337555 m.337555 type:complete len:97 (-) comp18162_c0_seq1:2307-2597(-)
MEKSSVLIKSKVAYSRVLSLQCAPDMLLLDCAELLVEDIVRVDCAEPLIGIGETLLARRRGESCPMLGDSAIVLIDTTIPFLLLPKQHFRFGLFAT